MHDDYLWDETGELDAEGAEVVALQRTLAPLRYEVEPLRIPHSTSAPQGRAAPLRWVFPVLAAAAALAMVLVLRPGSNETPEASLVFVSAQEPQTQTQMQTPQRDGAAQHGSRAQVFGAKDSQAGARSKTLSPESARSAKPALKMGEAGSEDRRSSRRKPSPPKTSRKPSVSPPEIDCILDPALCPGGRSKQSRAPTKKPLTVDCVLDPDKCEPSLDRLSASHIRAGILPVRPQVEACGPRHGAPVDSKLKVKLSIEGATGRVSKAEATGEWKDTPLGRCAEKAVSKARFPRFKSRTLGVQYPFTMRPSKARPIPAESATDVMREVSEIVNFKARACALAHGVAAGTRVHLELKISAAGRVTKVSVRPRDPLSADATRCLSTAIGKTVFSPSTTGFKGRIPLSL